jgi:hypothetical protein
MSIPNYYEFLQISRHAEPATIHRVYHFLAARYHPDNAQTGDVEKFMLLKQAYEVLSDPERRAAYEAACEKNAPPAAPLSMELDFMDNLKGELNRRLGLLALLYARRRTNPSRPEVSLIEVEQRMGFPRDYLEFTMWYLQKKGYITRADNSDFALTAEGVDFVETQREQVPVLNKLLTSDASPAATGPVKQGAAPSHAAGIKASAADRRADIKERRTGAPDRRAKGRDSRVHQQEQRAAVSDRRARI